MFIHGGSFVTGGLHSEDSRCERYALEADCVVVALDYRLAPEHPFPAGLDELSHFDVVFLGDVGVGNGQLTEEQCGWLKGLVEHQASGIVFIARMSPVAVG